MIRRCYLLVFFAVIGFFAKAQQPSSRPNQPVDSSKKSIAAIAKGEAGSSTITITYFSPRVRGRMIWGGLVPYNEVWVSGAHMATKISFSKAARVGNKIVAAGTYAIFTIPGTENWTFILNRNYKQHLTDDYDAKEDVLRLTVRPLTQQKHLERLEYFIQPGKIVLAWERIRIEVPIQSIK